MLRWLVSLLSWGLWRMAGSRGWSMQLAVCLRSCFILSIFFETFLVKQWWWHQGIGSTCLWIAHWVIPSALHLKNHEAQDLKRWNRCGHYVPAASNVVASLVERQNPSAWEVFCWSKAMCLSQQMCCSTWTCKAHGWWDLQKNWLAVFSYGGFLKWWYPTTLGFPTKNDHFGVFWGYHHFRKHPYHRYSSHLPVLKPDSRPAGVVITVTLLILRTSYGNCWTGRQVG